MIANKGPQVAKYEERFVKSVTIFRGFISVNPFERPKCLVNCCVNFAFGVL